MAAASPSPSIRPPRPRTLAASSWRSSCSTQVSRGEGARAPEADDTAGVTAASAPGGPAGVVPVRGRDGFGAVTGGGLATAGISGSAGPGVAVGGASDGDGG